MADNTFDQASFDAKLGEIVSAITDTQDQMKSGKASYDADVKAAGEAAAIHAEEMQQMRQTNKGIAESNAFLEKQLSRVGDGGGNEEKTKQTELHKKMDGEIARYLRTGENVTSDVLDEMHKDMTKRALFGASDAEVEAHIKGLCFYVRQC